MGFLMSFFPENTFPKIPIPHFTHKTLPQTNIDVVAKLAEHLQHFSDMDRVHKQIWLIRIFLNWWFNQDSSLI